MSRPPAPVPTGLSGLGTARPPAMPQRTAAITRPPVEVPQHDAHPPRSSREDRRAIRDAVRRRRRVESAERRGVGRRRPRLVLGAALGVVVLLVGVPVVLAFGPVFPVRTVTVQGGSEALSAQVRQALAGELGKPVALVGDAEIAAALAAVPAVERFTLVRRPPDTIELVVVPRTPIAQVYTATGWAQVDAARVTVSTAAAPGALPVVTVPDDADRPARSFAAAASALTALAGSSPAVSGVRATSPDDVVVTLRNGLLVRWGGTEDGPAKAEALRAALRRAVGGATEVDVSSPGIVLTR